MVILSHLRLQDEDKGGAVTAKWRTAMKGVGREPQVSPCPPPPGHPLTPHHTTQGEQPLQQIIIF